MKTRKLSVITLLTLIACLSCERKLELTPQGVFSETIFWKTDADAVSAINGAYNAITNEDVANDELFGRPYLWYLCASDDLVIGRSGKTAVEDWIYFRSNNLGKSDDLFKKMWANGYTLIKRANDVIRNLPKSSSISDATKKRVLGEAQFLAALGYFIIAPIYGNDTMGVPILDPEAPEKFNVPRATNVGENYTYIENLLQKAADNLPYFDELQSTDYGRAHKTAALALLAKTYLYHKNYAKAKEKASEVMSSGKHSLLPNFADVFRVENNWSKEYLIAIPGQANPPHGNMFGGVMLLNGGFGKYNGWGYFQPTKSLYDSYEAGDKRRISTVLAPGDEFKYFDVPNGTSAVAGKTDTYIFPTIKSDGYISQYMFSKFFSPFESKASFAANVSPNGDYPTTNLSYPIMRYADLILVLAEAKLMLGENADTEINMIRTRAGLNALSGATLKDLKKERRNELAGEMNNRYYDLVRWGDAQATFTKPLQAYDGTEIIKARSYNPSVHNVFPIPFGEIQKSQGVLIQNAGY